ncbi:helix-turn-helix domain-containing protein [Streptomyces roseoviridis]|uniref:Helix-turn-helix domain-containing protein n=1 Tax=Streptomyces roseoviridis TaxID=67361 RepID=A0ABV5QXJ3_9ACTN
MIGTVFRSEDVPTEDRFDCWRELTGRTRHCEAISPHAADYRAELRHMEMGPVTVWKTSIPPTRFVRNATMARRDDPELYHLTLVLDGDLAVSPDAGPTATVGPSCLTLIDSSTPYDVRSYDAGSYDARAYETRSAGPERDRVVGGVAVDLPKAMLPLSPHRVRHLLGRSLPAREGTGALLADFLVGLERQAAFLQPSDGPRLGTVVRDLMAAWLAHLLEAEAALPPETRQEALLQHIRAFIQRNLHDPELTPGVIAAAHHISLSHLHRVFTRQSGGETVAASIRAQRLDRAHRDLADPALQTTPIHAVAARWGMTRASDFTRAFRAAYGLSPKEHRQRSLSGADTR